MKFERFEDIIAWQKAMDLTVSIYKEFEESKDYGFKDQIQRAGVSVMNNIAEGFERRSNNEFNIFYSSPKVLVEKSDQCCYLPKILKK